MAMDAFATTSVARAVLAPPTSSQPDTQQSGSLNVGLAEGSSLLTGGVSSTVGLSVLGASAVATTLRRQRRRVRRREQQSSTTFVPTQLPKVDRSATQQFRKTLRNSDQYFKLSSKQMKEAQEKLKSVNGSELVDQLRQNNSRMTIGDITFVLAESLGFCWGVERTLALAHEARRHYPDSNIWVTNEIIHNAVINRKLAELGMKFVAQAGDGSKDFSGIEAGDVCILPAFGASVDEMAYLMERQVQIVDTTCPFVSKVWASVEKTRDKGYTSILHGKFKHEETVATKSFAQKYLVVKDMKEAEYVSDYILGKGDREEFLQKFEGATSDGFDPDVDLESVGVANQTTMLKGETELIAKLFERVMIRKYGPQEVNDHFLAFNTICSATQERQDAMYHLLGKEYVPQESELYAELEGEQIGIQLKSENNGMKKGKQQTDEERQASKEEAESSKGSADSLDICIVIGGYNSSNTLHLIEIPEEAGVSTYHVDCAARIGGNGEDESKAMTNVIQHKPLKTSPADAMMEKGLEVKENFLPEGPVTIAVTAGASTPDVSIGECMQRILKLRNLA